MLGLRVTTSHVLMTVPLPRLGLGQVEPRDLVDAQACDGQVQPLGYLRVPAASRLPVSVCVMECLPERP